MFNIQILFNILLNSLLNRNADLPLAYQILRWQEGLAAEANNNEDVNSQHQHPNQQLNLQQAPYKYHT